MRPCWKPVCKIFTFTSFYLVLCRAKSIMKISGPNLDKNSVRLLDPGLFYENYTKLYFGPKLEKAGLNRG